MDSKNINLKEKLKQALTSTARAISDDYKIEGDVEQNKSSKKFDFFEIDNLNSKNDFIKARAEYDTLALKKKFSDNKIYKENLPLNSSCKSLYSIAEKIRYESLGAKMLKGIEKNLKENYNQIINLKRKDQLKTKDDVPIVEAFELYMLKNFHNIKLNSLTNNMLSFWEKDFEKAIKKHIKFLKENLESQTKYSSKFSEILQEMEIFNNEENEEKAEENKDQEQNNPSNEDQNADQEDQKDQNQKEETEASLDSDYDIDEYKLDEQLVDTDSEKQSNEQVIQKKTINEINLDYKVFTNQFDEIIKAEKLENFEEAISIFNRALILDPNLLQIHNNLGEAYRKKSDLEKAIIHFKNSLKLNPDYAQGNYNLAVSYFQKKSYEDSIYYNKEAIRCNPSYYEAYYNLAVTFLTIGDIPSSIENFDKCLKIDPNNEEALAQKLYRKSVICDWSDYENEQLKINNFGKSKIAFSPSLCINLNNNPSTQKT